MLTCGVVGDPIQHSLSPVLHRAGYAALGLDADYLAERVPLGTLAPFVRTVETRWRGISVTAPLKPEALALAGSASAAALAAGAANTLLRTDHGRWEADNTDIPGAVAALGEAGIGSVGCAVILGGGATATSVGLALGQLGTRRIELRVRVPARAADTADRLAAAVPGLVVTVAALDGALEGGDVLVSTIPASAVPAPVVDSVTRVSAVFDVVYDPWPTPLAAAAGAAGLVVVGGLDLLVHQAVAQFAAFTGQPAPLAQMRAAGEDALAARRG